MNLSYDFEGESIEVDRFDLNQIILLLNQMDGQKITELHVSMDDKTCLSIGGGFENEYIVSFAINVDESFFQLTSDIESVDNQFIDKEIVVGRQPIPYSSQYLVGIGKVEKAIVHYYKNKTMDVCLNWKREW